MRTPITMVLLITTANAASAQATMFMGNRHPSPGATWESLLEEARFRGGVLIGIDEPNGKLLPAISDMLSRDEALYAYGLTLITLGESDAETALLIRRRQGWGGAPRWALLDSGGRVKASGGEAPRASELLKVLESEGFITKKALLEAFLLEHPDHSQALDALVRFHEGQAKLRMEPLLDHPGPSKDSPNPIPRLKGQISVEDDSRIWGDMARVLEAYVRSDAWMDSPSLRTRSLDLAEAALSPLMKDTARRLLPHAEAALERFPWTGWNCYLSLSYLAGNEAIEGLLDRLAPSPGTTNFPPPTVVKLLADAARQRGEWKDLARLQTLLWDRSREPLRIVGNKKSVAMGVMKVWDTGPGPLVEAYLRLGETLKAEKVMDEAVAWSSSLQFVEFAVDLARRCDLPEIADRWSHHNYSLPSPVTEIKTAFKANTLDALLREVPAASYCWVLVDGSGGKARDALQVALKDEALLGYSLSFKVLTARSHPGLVEDLVSRMGWTSGTGWLLMDDKATLLVRNEGALSVQAMKAALDQAGVMSPVQGLEAFLKLHPDQAEALQILFRERFRISMALMQPRLRSKPASEDKVPEYEDDRELASPLTTDEDQRIWGPTAVILDRLFQLGAFQMGWGGEFRMSPMARHSPLMRASAARALPMLESWIEGGHQTNHWEIWVVMNSWAYPSHSASDLVRRCPPIPGRRANYPYRFVYAFNREALGRKDWPALVSFLEPLWITKEGIPVLGKEGTPEGDWAIKNAWMQMGPLVEAYLLLKEQEKATALVQELAFRYSSSTLLRQAINLARRCGPANLALQWNAFIPPSQTSISRP